jgi:hypothetical protein
MKFDIIKTLCYLSARMATESEKREKERVRLAKALVKEAGRKEPDLRSMRQLLEQGAYTDFHAGWDQGTAVTRLARKRNLEGVKLMIEFGADLELGIQGTPLDFAIENRDAQMVALLVDGGARPHWYELEYKLRSGGRDIFRLLLDKGAFDLGATEPGTSINCALHTAEKTGDPDMIAMMRAAVEKKRAGDAATSAAAAAVDPRDQRIADLEQQIRALASSLTAVQHELEDLKNPQPLDKKLTLPAGKPSPWPMRNSAPPPDTK